MSTADMLSSEPPLNAAKEKQSKTFANLRLFNHQLPSQPFYFSSSHFYWKDNV